MLGFCHSGSNIPTFASDDRCYSYCLVECYQALREECVDVFQLFSICYKVSLSRPAMQEALFVTISKEKKNTTINVGQKNNFRNFSIS